MFVNVITKLVIALLGLFPLPDRFYSEVLRNSSGRNLAKWFQWPCKKNDPDDELE